MASILTTTASLTVSGLARVASGGQASQITLAGDSDVAGETQDIGLSTEAITLGEIGVTNAASILIKNLDAANFISVGFATPVVPGTNTFKVRAGEVLLLTGVSNQLYALADTGVIKVHKWAVE